MNSSPREKCSVFSTIRPKIFVAAKKIAKTIKAAAHKKFSPNFSASGLQRGFDSLPAWIVMNASKKTSNIRTGQPIFFGSTQQEIQSVDSLKSFLFGFAKGTSGWLTGKTAGFISPPTSKVWRGVNFGNSGGVTTFGTIETVLKKSPPIPKKASEKEKKPSLKQEQPNIFLAQLGDLAKRKCLKIFEEFRKANIRAAESLGKDSLKSQLNKANRLGVRYSLILGQKEALEGIIIIKNMETGKQETIKLDKAVEEIKKRLKKWPRGGHPEP